MHIRKRGRILRTFKEDRHVIYQPTNKQTNKQIYYRRFLNNNRCQKTLELKVLKEGGNLEFYIPPKLSLGVQDEINIYF